MAASVGSVSIDLDAKIAKFESDIGRAARLLEKEISRAASVAERAMQRASREISKEVDQIAKKAEAFGKQVLSFFAISAVFDYAKRLAGVADEFSNIQAKIKLAAGEQVNLAKSTETVFNVAQKTFQSFDATTALVQRTATALKSAGRDASDSFNTAIRLAEVFNKTLVVSSATTQQAQAAVQQFAQAIGSGRLQGDEFRSITENNARFQVLLADALGVTTGKLKEMSSEGKLTVSTLLKVLNDTKKLDEEFAKMPLTIGRAMTLLSNAWTKFIGEGDQARGTSLAVAGAIKSVANNLDSVVNAVVLLGSVVATVYASKILKSGAMWIASLLEQIVMTRAATAAAAEMGMTLAAASGPASNLAKIFSTLGSAIGVAAAVLVGWEIGTYLSKEFAMVRVAADLVVGTLLIGWEKVKQGAQLLWMGLQIYVTDYLNMAREAIASTVEWVAKVAAMNPLTPQAMIDGYNELSRSLRNTIEPTEGLRVQMALVTREADKNVASIQENGRALVAYELAGKGSEKANEGLAASTGKVTQELDKMTVKGAETLRGLNAQEKAADQYAKAMDRLGEYANAYTKDLGATSRVTAEHNKRLDDIDEQMNKAISASKGLKNAKDLESAARDKARAALDSESAAYAKNIKELEKQKNIAGPILKGLQDRMSDAFLSDRDLAGVQAVRQLTDAYEALDDELKADVLPRMGQMTEAVREQALATYDAEKSAQFWRATWESAVDSVADVFGQFATGQIRSAKDLGKALQDVFKQTFQKIVAEMVKSGIMKMFASFFGGGSGGGGGGFWGTLIAGAAAYLGGSGSSGGVSVSQNTANGGINLSNQQTGGFNYGGGGNNYASYLGGPVLNQGANYLTGSSGGTMGPVGNAFWGYAGQFANSGAGYATAQAAPWAGALVGGMYGASRGDGGVGTAVGITAGVIAGYYAGTVAASAITYAGAAYAATAGAGAATAATATAGGAAAGASAGVAAIPIIGWVAAIVLAIDAISGGKALGTRYRPNTLQTDISFGGDGPEATASLTEWKYRRNIFQFNRGGSLEAMRRFGERQYRARDIPIDPELMAALQKVADDLDKTAVKAAEFLNTEVIEALDASFSTLQVFDKKGRLKRTETVGTILGKEYKESWEKFQIRMHAETIIATVGQLDSMASAIAEAYRKDADTLLDAASVMLQAQKDINGGDQLLGTTGTLESTFAWLEKHRVGDEKLIDTYVRLMQATTQYNDLLDKVEEGFEQLNKGSSAADQLRDALKQIDKQMQDNITALNAAAVAAGLTAASEKDLARIRELAAAQVDKISTDFFASIDEQIAAFTHLSTPAGDFASAMQSISASMRENEQMAHLLARAQGRSGASASELYKIYELGARQMAAAIAKLQDIGKQQARSLGYLGLETVSDYDTRIEQLENQAAAAAEASSAVNGFGGAMESVAQSATDAMNLLLGNLSPLNDQQKLQIALGGLSAGTASPEQVLEIGRRLYASTQQYTDLFNQVMNMRPRGATGGGSGGGRTDGNTAKPLTAAEEEELRRLRVEREEKIKQQRFAEATEFANTVASLAAAQGISFQQVADNIGFNLEDLGKDLGLSMDDLLKYLDGIDVEQTIIPDSITSNFDRLLAALDKYWGNGSGYYNNVEHDPTTDKYDANGRLVNPNRGRRPGPTGDASGDTSDRKEPDNVIAGLDNYTRVIADNGNRNTQQIVESTDRNTEAVRDLGRDMREGFGNQPRGTRWETPRVVR